MPLTDGKYGEITLEHRPASLSDEEPIIVFRASDKHLPLLLRIYGSACADSDSPYDHVQGIIDFSERVKQWRQEHPDRVKAPD